MRPLKIKYYLGIAGALVTTIGWLLSSADHYPFVYRIVVPKYSTSISAFTKMQHLDFVLKAGDDGFSEISEILKAYFEETISRETTQIKTLNRGIDVLETPQGPEWNQYLELEVSFSNEPLLTAKFYGLESKIKEAYLTSKALSWRNCIFGAGIATSLIAVFI